MAVIKVHGNFNNLETFLKKSKDVNLTDVLKRFGEQGVAALKSATPIDSGLTADSWGYKISSSKGSAKITFTNSNIVDDVPVAILLQYGHGTKNGGYVQGRDYINPAIQPIFDKIADSAWREVTT